MTASGHQHLDRPSTSDAAWGRTPGAVPPLRARSLLVVGVLGLVALTAVVLLLIRRPGPLDEATFADQRNGLIAEGTRVPSDVHGVAFGDRVVVLLFVRLAPTAEQVQTWQSSIPADRQVLVVVQQGSGGTSAVLDPEGELARVVGMPVPRDGGRPVGYAVIDSARRVRYATLDPSWPGNGFEVGTISRSVS